MPLVEVGGQLLAVPVRVSRRVKRPKLVVDGHRRAEVVVPPRTAHAAVEALLQEHRGWLERQLAKPPLELRLGLQRDDCVWFYGEPVPLPDAPAERWYRERAREEAARLATACAGRLGVRYRTLTVRDQRTRWGSCSTRGTLSVNWRLILAPPPILAYVVAHEVCHLVRHDHSREFWRLVAELRPAYADERGWLNEYGHELLAYRPPR
jgi:predicted metal-dependent hydrolase